MPTPNDCLMTNKADLGDTLLAESPPIEAVKEGEVVLALDRFSLTTNNITYAAYGDAIGYWSVFPSGRDGYGMMPVWGFAEVVESRAEGVAVGARVFGYFPMAERLVVQAEKISRGGFADAAPWRKAVPDIYNRYVLCAADANYAVELENAEAIFRPLFITSYTAVDFLREHDFFGAKQVVVSSASSKTAMAPPPSTTSRPGSGCPSPRSIITQAASRPCWEPVSRWRWTPIPKPSKTAPCRASVGASGCIKSFRNMWKSPARSMAAACIACPTSS